MIPSSPAQKSVASLDALTGLRFVAAFLVFVQHGQMHFALPIGSTGSLGGIAVAFFFVLSGFILTYVYHGRLNRSGIGKFYLTRRARIWPLHMFCLLAFLVLFSQNPFTRPPPETLKFFVHVCLLQSWVPDPSWLLAFNGVAWTISTEMAFYTLFPFLLLLGGRRFWWAYAAIGIFTAAGVVVATSAYRADPSLFTRIDCILHFSAPFRVFEFATGMAMGHLYFAGAHRRLCKLNAIGQTAIECLVIGVAVAIYVFVFQSGFAAKTFGFQLNKPILYYLGRGTGYVVAFAPIVWVFSWSNGLLGKLFSRRWFVFLGEISFAFYLIHQMIQMKVRLFVGEQSAAPWIMFFTCLGIAVGVSALLFTLVEVPCKEAILAASERKWRKARQSVFGAPWRCLRSGVMPAALVLCFGSAFVLMQSVSPPLAVRHDDPVVQSIIDRSRPEFRQVEFEDEAVLLGVHWDRSQQGLTIRMAWELKPERSRRRVVQVCDASGRILHRHGQGFPKPGQQPNGRIHVDTVFIAADKLKDAQKVGIIFFSNELKAASVNRGPRSMGKQRLDIIQLAETVAKLEKERTAPQVADPFEAALPGARTN